MLPLRAAPRSLRDAPARVEIFCHRPIYRSAAEAAFVARVRRAGAEVGVPVRVLSGAWYGRGAGPAGVFVSARLPTVVLAVEGRAVAQAVGCLSVAELRSLLGSARTAGHEGGGPTHDRFVARRRFRPEPP
jgi:hypothetical protein